MTIVCGTDFSESAVHTARAAAAIARSVSEPLKLVHVLGKAVHELPGLSVLYEPLRVLLAAQAEQLGKEFSVLVEPVVLEGAADERLIEFAQGEQARLLMLSALGSRTQDQWLLGSIAERVVQRSPTPVLVVRDADSILAWARGERPLRVVLGVDLGQSSRAALRWVEGLRAIAACDVELVQIAWPIGEHARFGVKGAVDLDVLRPDLQLLLERDLRTWAGTVSGQGEVKFLVSPCWGRFDAHLASLAQRKEADLLVVGTHRRSWAARIWQGSISRGAVHYSATNVACIPRPEAVSEGGGVVARYQSVLIPTDFSALANSAVCAGYGLVAHGGEVHLLHVRSAEHSGTASELSEQLRALIPVDAEALGITSKIHVVEGEPEPWTGIWHTATRYAVDVICMATHGRAAALDLLLGSQAEQVLRRARQPVLLVRGDDS